MKTSIAPIWLGIMCWITGTLTSLAQVAQTASVMSGFGGRSTSGGYTQIGSGAQPGGIGVSYEEGSANYAGGRINRAGFLNTFLMNPGADANGNGLPDELDPDNDGDGLWDHWEVTGEKFSPDIPTNPNLVDSDGNGISDFAEMIAGTNPNNINAGFKIIAVNRSGNDAQVTWNARGNNERIYIVRAIDNSYAAVPSGVLWSNTVGGGSAPWYSTTATITDATINARFFTVEVIKP